MKSKLHYAVSMALVLSSPLCSSGALIAYEGFEYPVGSDLSGQAGGTGWADPWTANVVGDTAAAGSLAYMDKVGNKLVTSGNSGFYSASTITNSDTRSYRGLPSVRGADGTTTWSSFLGVRLGPTNDTPNMFPRGANLSLYRDDTEQLAIGNASGAPSNTWALIPGGNLANIRWSRAEFSKPSLVVIRIDHKPGNDDAYLFVNPVLGVEPALESAAARSVGAFDFSFNRIRPFAGGTDTANNRPFAELQLDEIRIGETYFDVTPFIPAPRPIYQWDFDGTTSGVTVSPKVGVGGVLTLLNSNGVPTDLYTAIGGGVSGGLLANDRAFDNTASVYVAPTLQPGGLAASSPGNTLSIGTLSKLTLTAWIKPEADFAFLPETNFARILTVGAAPGFDGDGSGAYLGLHHVGGSKPRALEFCANSKTTNSPAISEGNVLAGSNWVFVAVAYDSTAASNNVKFCVGDGRQPLGGHVSAVTYPNGPIEFGTNAYAYLLNRTNLDRAFDGWGDDFRIYGDALDESDLDVVRASALGLPPVIVGQPQAQIVPLNSNAIFSVSVSGQGALGYQWKKEGVNLSNTDRISGATGPVLTITGVGLTDLGAYTVEVTNALGRAASDPAGLAMPAPGFCWARRGGGPAADYGYRLAVDSSGNTYVTGWFTNVATFGTNMLSNPGSWAIFLVKYDPSGNVIWAKKMGGAPSIAEPEWPVAAVDGEGNCYVTGKFLGTVDFGGVVLASAGAGDVFVAKYAPDGQVRWAIRFGSTDVDQGLGIATSATGDVFVAGRFTGSVAFGNTTLTGAGDYDMFVMKLDPQGTVLWARQAGGSGKDNPTAIAVGPDGACYVTGNFRSSTAAFDRFTLTNSGNGDMFVAKYSSAGALQWVRQAAGPNFESGYGIAVDRAGNCFVTGERKGYTIFGPVVLPVDGHTEMFVAKYDAAGTLQWVQRQSGSAYGSGAKGICTDSDGNCYVAGGFGLTCNFSSIPTTSAGSEDAFLAKYNAAGQLQWILRAGDVGLDRAWGITTDPLGNLYLCGEFQGSATFGSATLTSAGDADVFVAKLRFAEAPVITTPPQDQGVGVGGTATFSVTVAGAAPLSFQWKRDGTNLTDGERISGATASSLTISNVQLLDAAVYEVVVSNLYGAAAASATLTIFPTITTPPSSRTNDVGTTATFTVGAVGTEPLTYQWQLHGVNLKDSPHISGARTATLVISNVQPSDAGNYTVVVSNRSGSVTSAPPAVLTVKGAPTRIVRTTSNSGPGSLREALETAQPGDTILFDPAVFPPSAPATIYLSSALPGIWQGNITIDAANAGVILDGSRIGTTPEITLLDDVTLTLDGGTNMIANGDFSNGLNHWITYDNRLTTNRSLNTTDFVSPPQCYQITLVAHDGDAVTFYDTTNRSGPADIWPPSDPQRTMWIAARPGQQVDLEFWVKNLGDVHAFLVFLHQDGWAGTLADTYLTASPNWRKIHLQGVVPSGGIGVGMQIYARHSCRYNHGLFINSPGCVLRGLQIINFPGSGVWLDANAVNCVMGGNRSIGTGPVGQGNRVSGNIGAGVNIWAGSSNVVAGNFIGTDLSGTGAERNLFEGVILHGGASRNTVGSAQAGENNIISGNSDMRIRAPGIELRENAISNRVIGNFIGVDVTGTRPLGNASDGIRVQDKGGHIIGGNRNVGTGPVGEGNLISGNFGSGISAINSVSNRVSGNLVGTDVYGTNRLPNLDHAVCFWGGTAYNLIGGTNAGEGNVISGNGDATHPARGLVFYASSFNTAVGNFIGVDITGTNGLPNYANGVEVVAGSFSNRIGGCLSAERNVISGNREAGIGMCGANSNVIQGNYVGVDATGNRALGNGSTGIAIWHSGWNLIGGTEPGAGNVISGNGDTNWGYGVVIAGTPATNNRVVGNLIGLNAAGTAAVGNNGFGLEIAHGASRNVVGGTTLSERNIISGNRSHGLVLSWGCFSNTASGNFVGTDATGTNLIGNGENGVALYGGSFANMVGGAAIGACNTLAGNMYGIQTWDAVTRSNTFSRNSIYSNRLGGISLEAGANGGIAAPMLALVSSNSVVGVAGPGYKVEIFSDSGNQGRYYEGTTIADDTGYFSFVKLGGFTGTNVTATATDPSGNTSAFGLASGSVPLFILIQPQNQSVPPGSTAVFSVTVIGQGPLAYQWLANGTNLVNAGRVSGATSSSLTISNVQRTDAGSYWVTVSSPYGSVTSKVAVLRVGNVRWVTSTNDSGPGTLRARLEAAQPDDLIMFDASVFPPQAPATIYVSNGLPALSSGGVTIDGSDAGVVLDGSRIGATPEWTLIDDVSLRFDGGPNVLTNGDFSNGLNHWFMRATAAGHNCRLNTNDWVSAPRCLEVASIAHAGELYMFYDASNRTTFVTNHLDWPLDDQANSSLWVPVPPGTQATLSLWKKSQMSGWLGLATIWGRQTDGSVVQLARLDFGEDQNNWRQFSLSVPVPANTVAIAIVIGVWQSQRWQAGLWVPSASNTIRGLQIVNFPGNGIAMNGAANTIGGNRSVGTAPLGQGNLLSANGVGGIECYSGASNTVVVGNFVGTELSGNAAQGNRYFGVRFYSSGNRIGGTAPGEGNLISGNKDHGLWISGAHSNRVVGNIVGLNASGTAALSNWRTGVVLSDGASHNVIGGSQPGERNLVGGNGWDGIGISGGSHSNIIRGNFIGTDTTGTGALGNSAKGIRILDSAGNVIGGRDAGEGNVISGNASHGVEIEGTGAVGNRVMGNFVGTDAKGTNALGNGACGIRIAGGAAGNVIGGSRNVGTGPLGEGNLISGNNENGVAVSDTGTSNNIIRGNYIGTDRTGSRAIPNRQNGVFVSGGSVRNIVGGSAPGEGNVVSGNSVDGVRFDGADNNTVLGNFIGTDRTGRYAVGNNWRGVAINYSSGVQIGGTAPGEGNVISGNNSDGIIINSWGTNNRSETNRVQGNLIGLQADGISARGNAAHGIYVRSTATNNLIGGAAPGAGNSIAYNAGNGIWLEGAAVHGTTISRNSIFQNAGVGISPTGGANQGVSAPILTRLATNKVAGVTRRGYLVEIFSDTGAQGRYYEGTVVADDSGCFTFVKPGGFTGAYVTATATDPAGNTSAFGVVRAGTPPVIVAQPQDQVVAWDNDAVFSVTVAGNTPLHFQLQRDGTNIAGATYFVSGPSCVVPPHGLVGWWPGDGSALDIVGTNHGQLLNGATATATGIVDRAFAFDGANDYVATGREGMREITNNFTMEFWAYPTRTRNSTTEATSGVSGTSAQRYAIFPEYGSASSTGPAGAGVSVGSNGISVFEHADNYLPSLLVYNATITGWTHVAVVYQDKQPRLYVNGVLVRTGLKSARSAVYPSCAFSGYYYGPYGGLLDEISIYNTALPSSEIGAIYAAGPAGKCKSGTAPTFTGVLTLPRVQHEMAGHYTIVVSNAYGIRTSTVARLTVPGVRLKLLMPDESGPLQLVLYGEAGRFYVIQTSTNLIDWTEFAVVQATNGIAVLPVNRAEQKRFFRALPAEPTILVQPNPQFARISESVMFCVGAVGRPPFSYQWWFNGTNLLAGQTNACLVLTNVQPVNAGDYSVVISNAYGVVTSAVARLEVATLWLEAPVRQPDGRVALTLHSPAGSVCELWATTNVALPFAQWTQVGTITNTASTVQWTDPITNLPWRYYRARLVP